MVRAFVCILLAVAASGKLLDCGEETIEYDAASGSVIQRQAVNGSCGVVVNDESTPVAQASPAPPAPRYNPSVFTQLHRDERFGLEAASRCVLRAPVHTCTIKFYPGQCGISGVGGGWGWGRLRKGPPNRRIRSGAARRWRDWDCG
jgi:hypothetical protein